MIEYLKDHWWVPAGWLFVIGLALLVIDNSMRPSTERAYGDCIVNILYRDFTTKDGVKITIKTIKFKHAYAEINDPNAGLWNRMFTEDDFVERQNAITKKIVCEIKAVEGMMLYEGLDEFGNRHRKWYRPDEIVWGEAVPEWVKEKHGN